MTQVMYDAVDVNNIPASATAVAGYVGPAGPGNRYVTFPTVQKKWKHATKLSIAAQATLDAECLDFEPGDATDEEIAGWFKRQLARGIKKPVLYASRDNVPAALKALNDVGITRGEIRIWSAHYGLGPHICSPASCGASFTADGTQWTNTALGKSLDESLLSSSFFPPASTGKKAPKAAAVVKKTAAAVKPHPKTVTATAGAALGAAVSAALLSGGVHITAVEASALSAVLALITGKTVPIKT